MVRGISDGKLLKKQEPALSPQIQEEKRHAEANSHFIDTVAERLSHLIRNPSSDRMQAFKKFLSAVFEIYDHYHGNSNSLFEDDFGPHSVSRAADYIVHEHLEIGLVGLLFPKKIDFNFAKIAEFIRRVDIELGIETSFPLTRHTVFDYPLYDVNGNPIDPIHFIGQPTLVYHWDSWCGACKHYIEDFQRLHAQYGDSVNYILLSTAEDTDESAASDFCKKSEFAICVREPERYSYQLRARADGSVSLPLMVIFDSHGRSVERMHPAHFDVSDIIQSLLTPNS